jgi:DNA-binding LytR/AlgR family response regulator
LREIRENLRQPKYKERFVIKTSGGIRLLETKQIAYIQMKNEIPFAFDAAGVKFPLGATLSELEKTLDPKAFFRLNRSEIVNLNFIENLKPDFHGPSCGVSEKFKHQIGFQHQPHAKYAQVVGKHSRVTLRPKLLS